MNWEAEGEGRRAAEEKRPDGWKGDGDGTVIEDRKMVLKEAATGGRNKTCQVQKRAYACAHAGPAAIVTDQDVNLALCIQHVHDMLLLPFPSCRL